jgi:hypothetical protein
MLRILKIISYVMVGANMAIATSPHDCLGWALVLVLVIIIDLKGN